VLFSHKLYNVPIFAFTYGTLVMLMRRFWEFIIIGLLLIALPSLAQDAPLFDATFSDGIVPESLQIQFGQYEVVDESLSYTVSNGGFLVIPAGISWTDYAIETRLKITSGSVWLQARTGGDLCSGYYLSINADSYDLSVADRECNFTILDVIESADVPTDWFTARIDVQGDQIRGYIDDELLLSATHSSHTGGYPIINVFPAEKDEAQVEFDSILVTELTAPDPIAEVTDEPTESPAITETPSPEITDEPAVDETPVLEAITENIAVELPSVNEIPLNDDPQRVIETLQKLELIPTGEGQLYRKDMVYISRIGTWFEPLFEEAVTQHVVMSGTIDLLPSNEDEACLLSARITRDEVGVAQTYLDIGLNSRNEVFIGESADNGGYSQATQEDILTDLKGNFLFIAYGNRLSVYVDGQAAFQNIEITPREGSLGVSAIESTSFSLCQLSDIWAYTFEG
jgi:hypothetical protein